jgi:hypothetical protein
MVLRFSTDDNCSPNEQVRRLVGCIAIHHHCWIHDGERNGNKSWSIGALRNGDTLCAPFLKSSARTSHKGEVASIHKCISGVHKGSSTYVGLSDTCTQRSQYEYPCVPQTYACVPFRLLSGWTRRIQSSRIHLEVLSTERTSVSCDKQPSRTHSVGHFSLGRYT